MKTWLIANWQPLLITVSGVISGASIAVHALLGLKKWPRLEKIARALDWCITKLSKLSLNAQLPPK